MSFWRCNCIGSACNRSWTVDYWSMEGLKVYPQLCWVVWCLSSINMWHFAKFNHWISVFKSVPCLLALFSSVVLFVIWLSSHLRLEIEYCEGFSKEPKINDWIGKSQQRAQDLLKSLQMWGSQQRAQDHSQCSSSFVWGFQQRAQDHFALMLNNALMLWGLSFKVQDQSGIKKC